MHYLSQSLKTRCRSYTKYSHQRHPVTPKQAFKALTCDSSLLFVITAAKSLTASTYCRVCFHYFFLFPENACQSFVSGQRVEVRHCEKNLTDSVFSSRSISLRRKGVYQQRYRGGCVRHTLSQSCFIRWWIYRVKRNKKKNAELQARPPSIPTVLGDVGKWMFPACVAFLVSRCRNLLRSIAVSSGTCATAK